MKKIFLLTYVASFILTAAAATLYCYRCHGNRTVPQQVDCEYCVSGITSDGYKCAQCNGQGYKTIYITCPECNGTGQQTKPVQFPD